ncbi:signal peptidase II [Nocardioides sp. AN3]
MQAARGASLSDVAAPETAPAPPVRYHAIVALAWLAGLVIDQVTKALAAHRLADAADVRVVGSLLQLHLTRNAGAAFSTGTQFTVALSCLAAVATVVVVVVAMRARTVVWSVALGLLLAGITGNLTDRLVRSPGPLRGHVVDFLMLPHWPVFNVADVCITLAAALIVLQAYRGIRLDGRREGRQ